MYSKRTYTLVPVSYEGENLVDGCTSVGVNQSASADGRW